MPKKSTTKKTAKKAAKKTVKKAVKKTAKKATKKVAKKAVKKVAKKATKKVAKKAAKKTAKKATKKTARKKAKNVIEAPATTAEPEATKQPTATYNDVEYAAFLNYMSRIETGYFGDQTGDWLDAEKKLSVA